MNRIEGVRKERIYAVGCLLAGILLFGSICAVEFDNISLSQGTWQTICAIILGLFCSYGIWLEETRMVRKGRMTR